MEGEILCKQEAVWLLEDENILTHIKEEPAPDTVSDSEGASFDVKPVKREFCKGEAEEDEPEYGRAHTTDGEQDMCCKLEIEDNNILEDSSRCRQCPGLGGLQVKHDVSRSSVEAADHSEPDIEIPVEKESNECHFCNMGFSRVVDLVQHTRKSHTGGKSFMCKYCKKWFEHRYYLNHHIKTHTGEMPFSCEHCSKCFAKQSTLIKHVRTHRGQSFFIYKCRQSPGLGGLQVKHDVARSSVEAADHSQPDIEIPVQKESYECHFCHMSYSRVVDLVQHTRKSHTGGKPFMCKHCKKCFEHRYYLNHHIKTHTGEIMNHSPTER